MDKYQTIIAGFKLDIETISDGYSKSIVKHEFPNTDGALLEDMGQNGRSITIRCYFGALGGVATYEDYFKFIEVLKNVNAIEFVHPEDGTLKGRIERVDKRKDSRQQLAEVDITFLEGLIEAAPQAEISMPGVCENSFLDGIVEQQQCVDDSMAAELGAEGTSAAARVLDEAQGIMEQFTDITGTVRSYVAQVDAAVRTLEATLTSITNPANSILATVNFAANLPGRVIGSISRCVDRYAETHNALRSFPAQFQRGLRFSMTQLEASFRAFQSKSPSGSSRSTAETAAMTMIADQINLATSHRLALEAAYGFATDQQTRLLSKKTEAAKSFDLMGNYLDPVTAGPLMTQTDIEATLSTAMTAAQASVDLNRSRSSAIKQSIAALTDFARLTMLDSARIKQVDIDGTLPLHVILLKYGLPYNAADRVLAINPQIKHPNFVSGTINIYAA